MTSAIVNAAASAEDCTSSPIVSDVSPISQPYLLALSPSSITVAFLTACQHAAGSSQMRVYAGAGGFFVDAFT